MDSGNDQLEALKQRREDLRSEIDTIIDRFTDDAIADVFREVHA